MVAAPNGQLRVMRARTMNTIAPTASVPNPNAIATRPVLTNSHSQPASASSGGSGKSGTRNGARGRVKRVTNSATTCATPCTSTMPAVSAAIT
ncbi:MAG TPA: hypothetical protein VGU66_19725 [Candidatus Elarobacter sp.]|nr:hypothetical protein [Candidatus Elarobacter sp.]